jgi:hypothetical protein
MPDCKRNQKSWYCIAVLGLQLVFILEKVLHCIAVSTSARVCSRKSYTANTPCNFAVSDLGMVLQ